MVTGIIVLVFLLIILLDFLPGAADRPKKANVLYCALLAASFAIILLNSLGINVPGPSAPIRDFIEKYVFSPQ